MNLTDITKQIRAFADQLESTQSSPTMTTRANHGANISLERIEAAPVDPYAELKAAHAAGKVIQWKFKDASEWMDKTANFDEYPENCDFRIKLNSHPFQLPPPPPGMQWHRKDGWKAEDLPPGTRPLVEGEKEEWGDEYWSSSGECWRVTPDVGRVVSGMFRLRTTRPLVFEHEGKQWTWHRPGDPRPVGGDTKVEILMRCEEESGEQKAKCYEWGCDDIQPDGQIIGWRYAEPRTREVELGPEDVPPGSVFRHKDWLPGIHRTYIEINTTGVNWAVNSALDWLELKDSHWQINRSLPLTGKWNPDAWEPCHKEAKP